MEFWARRSIAVNIAGAALFIAVAAILLAPTGMSWFAHMMPRGWAMPVRYGLIAAATLLVARLYDRMPSEWTGIGLHRWAGRELLIGVGIGVVMTIVAWGPIAAMGGVVAGDGWTAGDLFLVMLPMALNAAGEELLFRGYLFQRASEILGPVVATLLSAGAFAAGHLGNPGATPASTTVIFLAGVFFALCYLRTGSLWLPIGAHLSWNLVLAKVLGLPVSGLDFGGSLLATRDAGPAWITGGSFGPEGGLLGIASLVFGLVIVAKWRAVTYSPYVNARVVRAFLRRNAAPNVR